VVSTEPATSAGHPRRRPSTVGALLLLVAALLAACGTASTPGPDGDGDGDAAAAEPRDVTLMLNWSPNAHHVGFYAALAQGWYEEAGLTVRVIEPAQAGVEGAVASGAADIGLAQAESLLPARAAGVPVVSVATLLPDNDSVLMSLAEDGITRPRALEGRRYGGFGGALETEILSRLVTCDGGDPDAVEAVNVGDVDYLAGLQADRFDVVWVFAGWDALRAEQVAGVPIEQIRFDDWFDCIPNWYTPLVLAGEDTIADDPDLVRDVLAVTARGYRFAAEDPEDAAALMLQQVPELDPALLEPAVAYYAPRFTAPGGSWGEQDGATWARFADFLDEAGLLRRDVDARTAFTNALLPSPAADGEPAEDDD
jgi:ABC-type nitrate/sulfonate/bicarbonate transport system substrate-binding protein